MNTDRRAFLQFIGGGIGALAYSAFISKINAATGTSSPNVILVLTDDQGYADLSCHGNPWLKTPYLDKLYQESVRCTNFHVSALCSPTRAALMTGRHCRSVGVHGTIFGEEYIAREVPTMANIFAANGYRTGMFGKWHLGDNYPYRPIDRGFQEAVYHYSGGLMTVADFWDNDYFDDTYLHNGKEEKFKGYCTDVWFEQAINFMKANQGRPFFCYLGINAPHAPYRVPKKYSEPYEKLRDKVKPDYLGMIANIDENMGRLLSFLKDSGLEENTILVFMTDNGLTTHIFNNKDEEFIKNYNSGMRGAKGMAYDGGHRVPFFVRWPAGDIQRGHDIDQIAAHIDVLPTLMDLCGLQKPRDVEFDGISLLTFEKVKERACISR